MKLHLRNQTKLVISLILFLAGFTLSHLIWSDRLSNYTSRTESTISGLVLVTCLSTAQKNFYGDLLAADESIWLNARMHQDNCTTILAERKPTKNTATLLEGLRTEWRKYRYLIEDLQEISTRLVGIAIEDAVDPSSEAYALMKLSEAKAEEIVFQGRKLDNLSVEYLGAVLADAHANPR